MTKSVTYGDGAFVSGTTNLNGDNLILTGTSLATEPDIIIGAFGTEVPHTLNSISEWGKGPTAEAHGEVYLNAFNDAGLSVGSLNLSYGNLLLGTSDQGSVALTGTSYIVNDSTYKAWGGRYEVDPTILKGVMVVAGGSTVDFSQCRLQGSGTIYAEGGCTVDVKTVSAGLRVDLMGAKLIYTNGTGGFTGGPFNGTIYENTSGTTDVLNATTSVKEAFNQSTGTLDLLNATGGTTAELHFVGDPTLYTTPDGKGGMDITTAHHIGSLPTIFTH
jgi:hypothetical protein